MAIDDTALQELLSRDPEQGWRAFVEHYTPALLASIAQAGITGRDEVLDVYALTCERLAADGCARLRRHDPALGTLRERLAASVRAVLVDGMRSPPGRPRLFKSMDALPPLERRIFELYYGGGHPAAEIGEMVNGPDARPVGLVAVMEALERIEDAFTTRQRGEILSFLVRPQDAPERQEAEEPAAAETPDLSTDPQRSQRVSQAVSALAAALAQLPPEDALIVSLRYRDGLGHEQVRRALHLPHLPRQRVQDVLRRLRDLMGTSAAAPGDFDLGQAPLRPEPPE